MAPDNRVQVVPLVAEFPVGLQEILPRPFVKPKVVPPRRRLDPLQIAHGVPAQHDRRASNDVVQFVMNLRPGASSRPFEYGPSEAMNP